MLTLVRSNPEDAGPRTFVKYCEAEGLSARTVSAYLSDLRVCGVTEATTPEAHSMIASRLLADEAAPSTTRRRLSSLAKFYDFVHPGTENPYRKVKRPTRGVVLPTVVAEPDESRALIEYALGLDTPQGYRTAAAVALMAGTGLRVGEVCDLTFGDLNPSSGSVRVVAGKGRKTRDVPLSENVARVVQEYAVNTFDAPPASSDRLFSCTPRTIQRDLAALTAAMRVRPLNPHAFRHGFATAVYRATTDLRLTADLLGHSHISTTTVYTHLADDRRAEAVSAAL